MESEGAATAQGEGEASSAWKAEGEEGGFIQWDVNLSRLLK